MITNCESKGIKSQIVFVAMDDISKLTPSEDVIGWMKNKVYFNEMWSNLFQKEKPPSHNIVRIALKGYLTNRKLLLKVLAVADNLHTHLSAIKLVTVLMSRFSQYSNPYWFGQRDALKGIITIALYLLEEENNWWRDQLEEENSDISIHMNKRDFAFVNSVTGRKKKAYT